MIETDNDYDGCLVSAGATVHRFSRFGSYQGDWLAEVTLPDGRYGFIHGYYGSCSGCDSFEAEIGYDFHTCEGDPDIKRKYRAANEKIPGCKLCEIYHEKKRAFGEGYFSNLTSKEATLLELQHDSSDAREMLAWVVGLKAGTDEFRAYLAMHGVLLDK